MKRMKLFTLLGLGVLAFGGLCLGTIKNSAHEHAIVAVAEAEETYTYEEDGVTATIVLKEDSSFTCIRNDHGEINEVTGTYSREGDVVALHYMGETLKVVVYPETGTFGEYIEPAEVFECSVVITESKNGTVTADKLEGHVGEIVTLNVKHDVLYLIKSVSVNGTELIEDEDISGKYTFALVAGENRIEAKFVVDEALLGEMSVIFEQAKAKDWVNLFSIENIFRIASFLLSSGILLAIVKYYGKDKKLEEKLERNVTKTVQAVIPEATKEIVMATIKDLIMPIFSEMKLDGEETKNALTVFSRCLALAQENTPEAKIAITQELSSLKLSDQVSIAAVKEQIESFMKQQTANFESIMLKMKQMEAKNQEIIDASSDAPTSVEPSEAIIEDIKTEVVDKKTHPYE